MSWYSRWGVIGGLVLAQVGAVVAYQVFMAGHATPARAAAQERSPVPVQRKKEPAPGPVPVVDIPPSLPEVRQAAAQVPSLTEPKEMISPVPMRSVPQPPGVPGAETPAVRVGSEEMVPPP